MYLCTYICGEKMWGICRYGGFEYTFFICVGRYMVVIPVDMYVK